MEISDFKSEQDYLAQMDRGMLLNPRVDSTFKALFTQPTPESRAALKSFLEAAIEQKIKTVELRPNDSPAEFFGQRGVSYDITCELDNGINAEIELQSFKQKYDYAKRAEYQVARLQTTYLKKGQNWESAPVVYQISILGFIYTKKTKNAVNRFAMRTKDGVELANALNVVFVELPKIRRFEKTVETNTKLENWAIFLKDADKPEKQVIIDKITSREEGLMQAKKSLSNISKNRDYWIAQYHQELHERDLRSSLQAAERKGIEQGIAQGMAQGERNARIETARLMLINKMPVIDISKYTGLTLEEIAQL